MALTLLPSLICSDFTKPLVRYSLSIIDHRSEYFELIVFDLRNCNGSLELQIKTDFVKYMYIGICKREQLKMFI